MRDQLTNEIRFIKAREAIKKLLEKKYITEAEYEKILKISSEKWGVKNY